jgi:hypothetical protein
LVGARSSICSKAMVFQLDHNGKLFDAGTLSRFSKAGRRKKALSGKACGTASPEPTPLRPTGNTARGRHEAIRSGKRQRRVDTRSAPPPQELAPLQHAPLSANQCKLQCGTRYFVATATPMPLLNVSAPCSLFLFHRMRPLTTCVPKSRNTYRFATFR